MTEGSDIKAWVDQAKKGDQAAFGRIVTQYQKNVYAFVLGMVHESVTADELTQTTFLKAWKSLKQFRNESSFQTWLFQIALNTVRSWGRWRKIRWLRERPLDAPVAGEGDDAQSLADRQADTRTDADPAKQSDSESVQQRVRQAVETLPPREKEVLLLKHFQGLQIKEIAQMLGIAEGSVKAHLFHAMEKMRSALKEQDHEMS